MRISHPVSQSCWPKLVTMRSTYAISRQRARPTPRSCNSLPRTVEPSFSADTDFGALLAHARATEPSVILVRELVELRPPDLVNIILANLEVLEQHLHTGAIAAFTSSGIRVRALPLR